jgi:hypothetical protein
MVNWFKNPVGGQVNSDISIGSGIDLVTTSNYSALQVCQNPIISLLAGN